jgi:hypothetical protein
MSSVNPDVNDQHFEMELPLLEINGSCVFRFLLKNYKIMSILNLIDL